MKKLALLLALVMVIGALPVMALGDDYVTMTYFNADGKNASWLENPGRVDAPMSMVPATRDMSFIVFLEKYI